MTLLLGHPGQPPVMVQALTRFREHSQGQPSKIIVPGLRRIRQGDSVDHGHDFIEVVYVLKGSGFQEVDGHTYPIISGDLYVLPIGTGHHHGVTPGAELWYYDILFQPELFSGEEWQALRALPRFATLFPAAAPGQDHPAGAKLTFAPPVSDTIGQLVGRMSEECLRQPPGWPMLVKSLFVELLILACREEALPSQAVEQEGPVAMVLAELHARSHERLTIEELAALAGVSPGYLGEQFKARTGESIHRYLMRLRIERAREMMATTDRSVTDIALRCGFEDSSYFARVFRQIMGTSPRHFRKRLDVPPPAEGRPTATPER